MALDCREIEMSECKNSDLQYTETHWNLTGPAITRTTSVTRVHSLAAYLFSCVKREEWTKCILKSYQSASGDSVFLPSSMWIMRQMS